MGWWKCNKTGGIDWDNPPSGSEGGNLINAIPNRDTSEDHYNGDAPADVMDETLHKLSLWFKKKDPKPTSEQLIDLLVNNISHNVFNHINKTDLDKLIQKTWKNVDNTYLHAWKRKPYPEERIYVAEFCCGGIDEEYWQEVFNHE